MTGRLCDELESQNQRRVIARGLRDALLTANEMALFLGVPRRYIADATLAGMPWPGGRLSPSMAKAWIASNPTFRILAKVARTEKAQTKSSLPQRAQTDTEPLQTIAPANSRAKRRASV